MKFLFLLFSFLLNFLVNAQINGELQRELYKIDKNDQSLRRVLFIENEFNSKKDSLVKKYNLKESDIKEVLKKEIVKNDSLNILKIDAIIDNYGYPGKSLVGEKASLISWEVIQHSKNPRKYIDLLKIAADRNEIPYRFYAMTLDRALMYENKPQIYGSQGRMVKLNNNPNSTLIIWPIENPKEVNRLRKEAGFENNIKKYAKQLGIKYVQYTIDALKM